MPDLNRLIRPKSVAIIGASDNERRIGGRPLRILRRRGYPGEIYPVNPEYETVQGIRCYRDIESLPQDIDLYLICVPAGAATDSFERAAARGAGAAVVFAGGFAETGAEGKRLQERLSEAASTYDVALVGPNSLGYASIAPRTYGTFATMLETLPDLPAGNVALVSQSGGTAFNLLTEAHWSGVRFSHVIATGNEAGLTFADYVEYLAGDDVTEVIVGYLEGTVDGGRLGDAFEATRRAGKPVFVLKAGASARGSDSVASHTAQISGDDDAFDALFERYGVVRLRTMDEAVDVARAAALGTPADGVAIASNSGGAAAYLSDAAERHGVPLVDFSTHTIDELRAVLPPFAGVRNPLDFTPQVINEPALLDKVLSIIDGEDRVDLLLLYLGGMEYLAGDLLPAVAGAARRLRVPIGLAWYGVNDEVRRKASAAGLVVCADPVRLLAGAGLLRRGWQAVATAPGRPASGKVLVPVARPAFTPRPVGDGRSAVDEAQVMRALAGFGLTTPRHRQVSTADEAVAAARQVGFPCVLKLIEPMLAHRAKVGAVHVGLDDADEVRAAFESLVRDHDARQVLVAQQIARKDGVELIAGVVADRVFGTRALLGAGGVDANDAADSRSLVPPYDMESVRHTLTRLRVAGRIPRDLDTVAADLAAVVRGLAVLVADPVGRPVTEVECNPILVTASSTMALDALAFVADDDE
ncbi:acetate--CoA ligase family protein [Actinophytocola oryzae]|uniref:Acyl-CoA synthetase (NDP forming) n=1 Tax=Actinophytocola oryzae TaxID=502181 RepID=A0A4R7W4F8_9PSEU|nr:acetate--CoA ligase family protein [Actinophytocola oryzae]TDV57402.1 acyl-CoA synthetase (NDP forming) [Actinophytocola oryzae]